MIEEEGPKTHVLSRMKRIMELYSSQKTGVDETKNIEFEFGDKSKEYVEGDTLILYHPQHSDFVSARVASVSIMEKKNIEHSKKGITKRQLKELGASHMHDLREFIAQHGPQVELYSLVKLENIEVKDRMLYAKEFSSYLSKEMNSKRGL